MLTKYGSPDAIAPGDLAKEFIGHAGLSTYPSFMEMHSNLRLYGVQEISGAALPPDLRAHHFRYQRGDYSIIYEQDSWSGSVEFVMGHELFEIIHETFEDLVIGYTRRVKKDSTCMGPPANRFSAAIWMQSEVFTNALFSSGFNIMLLHRNFNQSYAGVGIRAVDVLNQRNAQLADDDPVELMVVIYERNEGDLHPRLWSESSPENFKVRYPIKTPGIKVGRRGGYLRKNGTRSRAIYRAPRYPGHSIPRRGDPVIIGSLADQVIQNGLPIYLDRAWGYDLWGFNDLSVLAAPVEWYGNLAKVVLILTRRKDSHLLIPALDVLKPIIIEDSFQVF
jgi:hypothetical protein